MSEQPATRSLLVAAALLLPIAVAAAPASPPADPVEVARTVVDPARYPGVSGVYLKVEVRHNQTRAGVIDHIHELFRLLTPEGLEKPERRIFFHESQRVEYEVARTILPDGREVRVPEGSIRRLRDPDTGLLSNVIAFPDAVVGATLELKYRLHFDFPELQLRGLTVHVDRWIQIVRDEPIVLFRSVTELPLLQGYRHTLLNSTAPVKTKDYLRADGTTGARAINLSDMSGGAERRYTVELKDLPGARDQPYGPAPDDADVYPQLLVSTFPEWTDAAYEIGQYLWEIQKSDSSFNARVDAAVRGATNDDEKRKRLFDLVTQELRWADTAPASTYVKKSLPMPRTPLEILPSGFAMPDERSRVLLAALIRIGQKAYPAYVRPGKARRIPAEVPLFTAIMQKLVVVVEDAEGGLRFLDPTRRAPSYSLLSQDVRGHDALLITGRETGRLVTLPSADAAEATWNETHELTLAADGSATVRTDATFDGDFAARYRRRLGSKDATEWPGVIARKGESATSVLSPSLDEHNAPLQIRWDGSYDQLAVGDGRSLVLAPLVDLPDFGNLDPVAIRRVPIYPGLLFTKRWRGTVRPPAGFVPKKPLDVKVEGPYGRITATYSVSGNTVAYDITLVQGRDRVPAAEYGPFVTHWKAASRALSRALVFEKR